eukprot:8802939-Alexandrium_andersonii.AAC.1
MLRASQRTARRILKLLGRGGMPNPRVADARVVARGLAHESVQPPVHDLILDILLERRETRRAGGRRRPRNLPSAPTPGSSGESAHACRRRRGPGPVGAGPLGPGLLSRGPLGERLVLG